MRFKDNALDVKLHVLTKNYLLLENYHVYLFVI